ncbi:MAG TPA: hypothetical protein VLJ20_01915 [Acetobacteraceae bacterium]|nr:hypothetical protein [Acetobacteraceae bacterium]
MLGLLTLGSTWTVLAAFYLLCAGGFTADELIVAAASGLVGTGLSVLIRRDAERRFRLRAPWRRVILRPLANLAPDAARVARVLLSAHPRGEAVVQPFAPGGATPRDAGRRALVTLAASLAPNGYVLRIPDASDGLVMHRLAHVPPPQDKVWPL